MYSNDSHSASHLGNTDPCMDDFDIDSYVHINCAWNQNVKAHNILNEVRASQLAWAWVVSPIYIGRLVPGQYPSKVQLCRLNLVQGELPNVKYIIVCNCFKMPNTYAQESYGKPCVTKWRAQRHSSCQLSAWKCTLGGCAPQQWGLRCRFEGLHDGCDDSYTSAYIICQLCRCLHFLPLVRAYNPCIHSGR